MGQYYRPTILRKNHKLVTKSNPCLASLSPYDFNNGAKLMEHSYIGNKYVGAVMNLIADDSHFYGHPFAWVGDYADEVNGKDLYSCASEIEERTYNKYEDCIALPNEFKYLVNLTKKQYIELKTYKPNVLQVHPLPLLTAVGNGRGRGDYSRDDKRVGSWAFDRIGCTNSEDEIVGLEKVEIEFELDW